MDRRRLEELISGLGPSSAPSPYSHGPQGRKFPLTADPPPLLQSRPAYNMPSTGDGHPDGHGQQASHMQHQAIPPPFLHTSPAFNMPGTGYGRNHGQQGDQLQHHGRPPTSLHLSPAYNMPGRGYFSGHEQQPSQLPHQADVPPQLHPDPDDNMPTSGNIRGYGQQPSRLQHQADTPPLPHPSGAYNMPIRGDSHFHSRQGGQLQHQLDRSFSVLVIDDSDSDAKDRIIAQPSFTQHARNEPMDQVARHSQEPLQSVESEENDDDNRYTQCPRGNSGVQDMPEDQDEVPHDDARGHINALLRLPEVNIPEGERLETPRGLACELLPHQRVGLTWLIRQEQDPNKRGGILADGMGLGKTVESLALIVSRICDPRQPNTCKTTLIVAPLGLLPQWQDEINNKVTLRHGRKLSTIIYHGPSMKHVRIQDLLRYDVVLCTYGKLLSEYSLYTKGPRIQCQLFSSQAKFYRVILDEAHFIKNKKAQTALAVCQLQAVHRLCMTGTPLMNNVTELYPLIRFLRIKPYDDWNKFSEDIDRPIRRWKAGMETPSMLRLQTLVKSLMLRRSKDSRLDGRRIIDLEERVDIEMYVEFEEEQKAFYDALVHRQKLKFNKYLKAGTVMKNYFRVLTWLLRLRQACDHPYLIQNHCIPDVCGLDAEGMIRLALQLPADVVATIKATRHFKCPKCAEFGDNETANPVIIGPCGHYICAECYSALMEGGLGAEEDADKFACPDEWCDSIITPDNILMHNFFVDAQKGVEARMDFSDNTEQTSGDDIEVIDIDSEDEVEGINGIEPYHGDIPPVDQQHQGSSGLFVDPYPDEEEYSGEDENDDAGGRISVFPAQKSQAVEGHSNTRMSTAPRVTGPIALNVRGPIHYGSSSGYSVIERPGATPARDQVRSRPLVHLPSKGTLGNPVNLDDEEEEAAYNAASRQMAAAECQQPTRHIKKESSHEYAEGFDIPNFDGPGSPTPRSKRKEFSSIRPDSQSKRARAGRLWSRGPSDFRAGSRMYIKPEDEEDVFASPGNHQVNTVDHNAGQLSRAAPSFVSRDNIVDHGDRHHFEPRRPKIEDEDVKPEVPRLGQRAREVLQRPFVSLSNKRQLADHSKHAMAAYQKRIANEWVASAKTSKIIELLQNIRREHRGEKTLIFSIWTVFLDMLEPPLRKAGFKYTLYSGGMKTDNRNAAVETFMTNPELDVMLVSLCAGSCGLNLTAANHVILTEPFWNPFTEEQAIDRAHRLGQTKKVTVYRILVKGTVEDDIVKMQRRKRDLVGTALCDDAQADAPLQRLTLEELRGLFGI